MSIPRRTIKVILNHSAEYNFFSDRWQHHYNDKCEDHLQVRVVLRNKYSHLSQLFLHCACPVFRSEWQLNAFVPMNEYCVHTHKYNNKYRDNDHRAQVWGMKKVRQPALLAT